MSSILRVQWTITPRALPEPWLGCSHCGGPKPFRCSGKFRLNANGKRLDAWLIYKCRDCDGTWNRPLFERRSRHEIDPTLLQALQANDQEWARRFASDVAGLRGRVDRIEEFPTAEIRKDVLSAGPAPFSKLEILLAVSGPAALRTDRLLANELGLSRSRIQDLLGKGRLAIMPGDGKALRRAVRDGTRVTLDLMAESDGGDIGKAARYGPK